MAANISRLHNMRFKRLLDLARRCNVLALRNVVSIGHCKTEIPCLLTRGARQF